MPRGHSKEKMREIVRRREERREAGLLPSQRRPVQWPRWWGPASLEAPVAPAQQTQQIQVEPTAATDQVDLQVKASAPVSEVPETPRAMSLGDPEVKAAAPSQRRAGVFLEAAYPDARRVKVRLDTVIVSQVEGAWVTAWGLAVPEEGPTTFSQEVRTLTVDPETGQELTTTMTFLLQLDPPAPPPEPVDPEQVKAERAEAVAHDCRELGLKVMTPEEWGAWIRTLKPTEWARLVQRAEARQRDQARAEEEARLAPIRRVVLNDHWGRSGVATSHPPVTTPDPPGWSEFVRRVRGH